jgi:O-antigen/teichoic acid export membrane protein
VSAFRSLGRDLIVYGIMGGVSRSVNLLLLPILTRQFTPDEYGIIDLIATGTSLLALFMALSLENSVARLWFESAHGNRQKQLISSIIAFILCFGAILFSVIWLQADRIASLLFGDSLFENYIVLGALAALLMALSVIPQIILRMERKIMQYNALGILQAGSYVAIALLLIYPFQMGLQGVFVATVLASGLSLGVGLCMVKSYIGCNFSLSRLSSALRFSIPMFPAVAMTWVNSQADRFILLALLGIGAVGVFGVAAKIALIVGLVVSVFQQAWTPLAIAQINDESGRNEFYRRALNYYAGSMAMIALVLVAFSKEVLSLLAPVEYQAAYVVIPWLIGARILQGSGNITNLGMLISKRTFGNSVAAWIGAATNVAIGLLLIPHVGIWGAAIGSFIAGLIFTSLLCRFTMRLSNVHFDLLKVFGILLCYVITCIAFIVTYEFVIDQDQSLIARTLILCISICIISFLSIDASALRALRFVFNSND